MYLVKEMVEKMSEFVHAGTKKTPAVRLDAAQGMMEIRGSSIMEDTQKFYKPVFDWIREFVEHPRDLAIHIEFSFFNTSTARTLVNMLKTLSAIKNSGCKLEINWYYPEDDVDIMEAGKDFSWVVQMQFNYISRPATPEA